MAAARRRLPAGAATRPGARIRSVDRPGCSASRRIALSRTGAPDRSGIILAVRVATERRGPTLPADLCHAKAPAQAVQPPDQARTTNLRSWPSTCHSQPTAGCPTAHRRLTPCFSPPVLQQRRDHPDHPADRGGAASAVNKAHHRTQPFWATAAQRPGGDPGGASAAQPRRNGSDPGPGGTERHGAAPRVNFIGRVNGQGRITSAGERRGTGTSGHAEADRARRDRMPAPGREQPAPHG